MQSAARFAVARVTFAFRAMATHISPVPIPVCGASSTLRVARNALRGYPRLREKMMPFDFTKPPWHQDEKQPFASEERPSIAQGLAEEETDNDAQSSTWFWFGMVALVMGLVLAPRLFLLQVRQTSTRDRKPRTDTVVTAWN